MLFWDMLLLFMLFKNYYQGVILILLQNKNIFEKNLWSLELVATRS
jgi:hypothetical protein